MALVVRGSTNENRPAIFRWLIHVLHILTHIFMPGYTLPGSYKELLVDGLLLLLLLLLRSSLSAFLSKTSDLAAALRTFGACQPSPLAFRTAFIVDAPPTAALPRDGAQLRNLPARCSVQAVLPFHSVYLRGKWWERTKNFFIRNRLTK